MLYRLHSDYTNIPSIGNKPRFSLLPFVPAIDLLAEEKELMGILKSVYQSIQLDFYREKVHLNLAQSIYLGIALYRF